MTTMYCQKCSVENDGDSKFCNLISRKNYTQFNSQKCRKAA